MVAGEGLEPPPSGFRDRRSATELSRTMGGPQGIEPWFPRPQPGVLAARRWSPCLVGSAGLEPAASATPQQRSANLSYDPMDWMGGLEPPAFSPAGPRLPTGQPAARGCAVLAPSQTLCHLSYIQRWSPRLDLNQRFGDPNAALCQAELRGEMVGRGGVEPPRLRERRVYSAVGLPMPNRPRNARPGEAGRGAHGGSRTPVAGVSDRRPAVERHARGAYVCQLSKSRNGASPWGCPRGSQVRVG